jgi:Ca2+-binding RTX toxin-like protein
LPTSRTWCSRAQARERRRGTGNRLNNLIVGTGSGDVLRGGIGNDTLVGGAGQDVLVGGIGNDTYDIDNAKDHVEENSKEGTDTVRTSLAELSLDSSLDFSSIENLTLLAGALNGTGNLLNNAISGNGNANDLRGGLATTDLRQCRWRQPDGGSGIDQRMAAPATDLQ